MSITADEINRGLHREVRTGALYGAFMPPSDCSSTKLGNGDTSFAIQNMAKTARKYQHHTRDLTLKFFSGMPLEKLCNDIHQFLYWHFQYSIDGDKQLLRSPACSWLSRFDGIDCKSYSIFASTILLNAGIKHYMRRIKQAMNPDGFTHVYVVVPKNQKTANLTQGYYVIDGTINTMKELPYLEKDDVLVYHNEKSGLSSPLPTMLTSDTRHQKRQAWRAFVEAIDNIGKLNPNNPELIRLKARVYQLAKEKRTNVPFKFDNFSIILDGERFELLKNFKPQGLGSTEQELDNLLNESYNFSKRIKQATHEEIVAKRQAVTNQVGGAVSSVAGVVGLFWAPAAVVGVILECVTALVSLGIMLFSDPCSSAYYNPTYINDHLKNDFYPEFKRRLINIKKHFEAGTAIAATPELNYILREVDLGYASYQAEKTRGHKNECSENVLLSFNDFVKNIKSVVDNGFEAIKTSLKKEYNIAVIDVKGNTLERTLYFIVPITENPVATTYRKIRIEKQSEKRGIYPYNHTDSFDQWLASNVAHLTVKYGKEKAEAYRLEMLPFKSKIHAIRSDFSIPVVSQLIREEELHKQEYEIYLKYDTDYQKELLKEAKTAQEAYQMANAAFVEELKRVSSIRDFDEENRLANIKKIADAKARKEALLEDKKTKNLLLLGIVGAGILIAMNK